jgi:anti-sigma regulatory factor (Ser/Thr protein kinase)
VCPYDTSSLAPDVIDEALRTHPYVSDGHSHASATYAGADAWSAPFDATLPEPPDQTLTLRVRGGDLRLTRETLRRALAERGFSQEKTHDFVLAVHEILVNSVRHGGGTGTLRLWGRDGTAIAEISDRGWIEDPLVGRSLPLGTPSGGRGVWLAHQLCDLVQIRSRPGRTTVRLHLAR